jgi:hypothetical protein
VISDVFPYCGLTVDAIKYDGSDTAKAWLKHPANQIQLVSLQGAYDFDGDGVTSKDEFRKLFKATGSNANADLIFDQLDTDRSGFLTQAEIKALGQDRTGKGARAAARRREMIVTRREGGSESGHERYTNAHAALDCSGESCLQRPSP